MAASRSNLGFSGHLRNKPRFHCWEIVAATVSPVFSGVPRQTQLTSRAFNQPQHLSRGVHLIPSPSDQMFEGHSRRGWGSKGKPARDTSLAMSLSARLPATVPELQVSRPSQSQVFAQKTARPTVAPSREAGTRPGERRGHARR